MTVELSKLYDMDIFSDEGKYLGKVRDFIIDLEAGEVSRITMEDLDLRTASREQIKRIIMEKTVLYKNVKSVSDVIVITKVRNKVE